MAQVKVNLNGRIYRLECGDGEEARVAELADCVRARLAQLAGEFRSASQEHLLALTLLLMADELLEARGRAAALAAEVAALAKSPRRNRRGEPSATDLDPPGVSPEDLKLDAV